MLAFDEVPLVFSDVRVSQVGLVSDTLAFIKVVFGFVNVAIGFFVVVNRGVTYLSAQNQAISFM